MAQGIERYNDYCIVTEGYLEHFNGMKIAVGNMRDLLEDKKAELATVRDAAPPVAQVGQTSFTFGGSDVKLTQPEAACDRIQTLEEDIKAIEADKKKLERLIYRISRAKMELHPEFNRLLELRYMEEQSWDVIAGEVNYSERWCRELLDRAVEKIAVGLFGSRAIKSKGRERIKFIG